MLDSLLKWDIFIRVSMLDYLNRNIVYTYPLTADQLSTPITYKIIERLLLMSLINHIIGLVRRDWGLLKHEQALYALECICYTLVSLDSCWVVANIQDIVRRFKTHVYKVMFTLYPYVLIHFGSVSRSFLFVHLLWSC